MYEAIYCTASWVFGFLLAPSFLLSVAAGPTLSPEVTLYFEPGCYIFYFISQPTPSSTTQMLLCLKYASRLFFKGQQKVDRVYLSLLRPSPKLRSPDYNFVFREAVVVLLWISAEWNPYWGAFSSVWSDQSVEKPRLLWVLWVFHALTRAWKLPLALLVPHLPSGDGQVELIPGGSKNK